MVNFKKPTLEDKALITEYFKKANNRSCRFSFANYMLWAPYYNMQYAIIEGSFVSRSGDGSMFTFPVGTDDPEPALQWIFSHCEEEGLTCKLLLTDPDRDYLEAHYPGEFTINFSQDDADYIYETEKLIALPGKKYHGKRNHINKFKKVHKEWSYEPITAENKAECYAMLKEWAAENDAENDPEKKREIEVSGKFLELLEELGQKGGLIRASGRVVAFTIGEPLRDDTYVIHIEKAFASVDGAYPIINQQFLEHNASEYRYVNREEDTGAEGLRKAKLSYYPVMYAGTGFAVRNQK